MLIGVLMVAIPKAFSCICGTLTGKVRKTETSFSIAGTFWVCNVTIEPTLNKREKTYYQKSIS